MTKSKFNVKKNLPLLITVILALGLIAGLVLVKREQDLRDNAAGKIPPRYENTKDGNNSRNSFPSNKGRNIGN